MEIERTTNNDVGKENDKAVSMQVTAFVITEKITVARKPSHTSGGGEVKSVS